MTQESEMVLNKIEKLNDSRIRNGAQYNRKIT